MSFVTQSGDDLRFVDGLEPVHLERINGLPRTAIAHALRRDAKTPEPAAGAVPAREAIWHLPSSELEGAPPRRGDRIVTADASVWTIVATGEAAWSGRWRCTARDLLTSAGLDQTITIQRAVWRQASDGAPLTEWHDWRILVAAQWTGQGADVVDADARTQTRRRLRVYLAEPLELDHRHRVLIGDRCYRLLREEPGPPHEPLRVWEVEQVAPQSSS